jgi:putative phosphonate transport system ATP-binding protein
MAPALTVHDLTKLFGSSCPDCLDLTRQTQMSACPRCGTIVACAEIEFELQAGQTLGIVGESGSGKSTILRCLYGDVQPTHGSAFLGALDDGRTDVFAIDGQRRRHTRDFLLGMVYQHPRDGLDLAISAGGNISERLLAARWRRVDAMRSRAAQLLERMEVPVRRMDETPSGFSGGMQQRVQIARAVANGPGVVLLDEMTSGLDASVQAGVLDLIQEIQFEQRVAMLVVSHDLGVIRLLCERTLVMKNGRIVERGLTDQILEDPHHPYTQLLVSSVNT